MEIISSQTNETLPNSAETEKHSEPPHALFRRPLIASYFANVLLLSSISLLFNYSEFVEARGGNDITLGWIVSVGMVGAIVFRILHGILIDQLGARLIWLLSLTLLVIALIWHMNIDSVQAVDVYLARLLMVAGISGALGSWLTFVSLQAPDSRVAEVIGIIGSSGFVGMAIGPTIGDVLLSADTDRIAQVNLMFATAIGLVVASAICAAIATHKTLKPESGLATKFNLRLIRKYPAYLLPVALAMGTATVIPQTFLRPYIQSLNIENMSTFFLTYNFTAFTFRWLFRGAPRRFGLPAMVLVGLICVGGSMPLYLVVDDFRALVFPAFLAGLSHAFLFPAVMALGAAQFSQKNRGLAINITFAINDFGMLVGAPLIGISLKTARWLEMPDYPTVFCLMAVGFVCVIFFFAIAVRRKRNNLGRQLPLKDDHDGTV
jgi:MFS family permease